jgi:hypothetical protein
MISLILQVLLTVGAPLLKVVLNLLVQLKILKTQQDAAEIERRFQAALKAADAAKNDAVSAQKQYNAAHDEAERKWKEKFGGQ